MLHSLTTRSAGFHCRSLTCGRCTRNAAGISSPPEIASVNSTRTSWARAERPGCPGASPAVFQTGSEDREIKRNVSASLPPSREGGETASCHSPAHFLHTHISDLDSFMTACCLLLHITPRSLHNFCSWTLFWRNPGWRGVKGRSVAHAMHPKPQLQYLENVDLDAKRVFGVLTRAPVEMMKWRGRFI